ncbi:MAG: helix-turn-helix domain-containing protein [Rhodanobacteraceae bacterium]|nr:helix-turn-helix domain-containing protein [Rhodanobacteraceae bacterium]
MTPAGDFLYTLRLERGWTQAALAKRLRVSDSVVARYERGKTWIPPRVWRVFGYDAPPTGLDYGLKPLCPKAQAAGAALREARLTARVTATLAAKAIAEALASNHGVSLKEIAKSLGVSVMTVRRAQWAMEKVA